MIFSWLIIIILAYFFFSLSYLGDKLVLSGPPKAGSYTFAVGALSALVIVLIPFIKFAYPDVKTLFWVILTAIVYVIGLYVMFEAVAEFDVSGVMTTIGAVQPVLIFALGWLIFGTSAMSKTNFLAFILLLLGSIMISSEKKLTGTGKYLLLTIFSALMFSLDYVFQKIVFLNLTFWQGLIWTRIFIFAFSLFFLLSSKVRGEIFAKKGIANKKTGIIFICSQTSGGLANFLQSFAISLTPIAFLPILNSLRGIQYVFLFLMTLFLTVFFPKILKEKTSGKILIQKIASIVLIVIGLALLVY